MKYILGVDVGTSGTKTVLYTQSGELICSSTSEYPMFCPHNGWAEQNPNDWWNATKQTIKNVLDISHIDGRLISGIGISGQMHGLVMVDKCGEAIRNCILWCDGRTSTECNEITTKIGKERLIYITANPALPGFTASKVMWVKKNEPDIYKKCFKILLPKDYIRLKLCRIFATDVTDASGTNLFDVKNRKWSSEILDNLEINENLMPEVFESSDITGYLTKEVSGELGLSCDTAVVGGAADNMAAAIGTFVTQNGKALTTLGTSGVILAHSDNYVNDKDGRVHTFCSAIPHAYCIMSCTLGAGLSLRWVRDTVCKEEINVASEIQKNEYWLMDKEAENSPIGANKLIFLPYIIGERSPILDEKARGVYMGLSVIHKKRDIIRSTLEGIMYSQKQCLEVFSEMGINIEKMYACGGGATSNLWRQMMCDIYDSIVVTTDNTQGPALGAAILAAVGVGLFENIEAACKAIIKDCSLAAPIKENHTQYMKYYNIYKNLYPLLKDEFNNLYDIV